MDNKVVRIAVRVYWVPPFFGTLITCWMIQRTKSIQLIAAAKEKPATIALRDWVSNSWVTRLTLDIGESDILGVILYVTKIFSLWK